MINHQQRIEIINHRKENGFKIDYKVVSTNQGNIFPGTWFYYSVDPVIDDWHELQQVVSDIIDKDINIMYGFDGKIRHSESCGKTEHNLSQKYLQALDHIKRRTFKIALWADIEEYKELSYLHKQPVGIVINEDISHYKYPEQLHLNSSTILGRYYLPESLCYQYYSPDKLPNDNYVLRVNEAIDRISEWLLRHLIWETFEPKSDDSWIGKNEKNDWIKDLRMQQQLDRLKDKHYKTIQEIKNLFN